MTDDKALRLLEILSELQQLISVICAELIDDIDSDFDDDIPF